MIPTFRFALKTELTKACADNKSVNLTPQDFLPTRAHLEDTGYDVRCALPKGLELVPGCYFKIPLGFRAFIPQGWWLELKPRSSTFTKRHIIALYGTIGETYENEMIFAGKYDPDACAILGGDEVKVIEFGEKIGQLIPVLRQDMEVISCTDEEFAELTTKRQGTRGESGFGDSGKF